MTSLQEHLGQPGVGAALCRHCRRPHPPTVVYRCDGCCALLCEQQVFMVDPTSPMVHGEDGDLETACGLAFRVPELVSNSLPAF